MDIRIFQIVVPIIVLIFIGWQFSRLYQAKVVWKDIWPSIVISIIIGLVALYPDAISGLIGRVLDFKSKVNALLFTLIGILFVALFKLYDLYRKQQTNITKLTIELSILMAEKNQTAP